MAQFKAQKNPPLQNNPVYTNVKAFVEDVLAEADPIIATERAFEEFIVDPLIADNVKGMGFNYPSILQSRLLTKMDQDSRNLIVISMPGTGKTVATSIGVLNYVNTEQQNTQILYLCTTHEAAVQTTKLLTEMAIQTEIKVGTALKNSNVTLGQKLDCHILVGTPKEMVSFKIMRHFDIEQITLCVFDDADTIVTTTLIKEHIIANLTQSQKVLLSSNSRTNIDFANPYVIQRDTAEVNVKQCFTNCKDDGEKLIAILAVYDLLKTMNGQGIIFFETREMAEGYGNILKFKGVSIALLHSGLSVDERNDELEQFKNGHRVFVVTTNLLARGVNIANVKVVINFDIPKMMPSQEVDTNRYLYRIGRSCHIGKRGIAINLVDSINKPLIERLMTQYTMTQI